MYVRISLAASQPRSSSDSVATLRLSFNVSSVGRSNLRVFDMEMNGVYRQRAHLVRVNMYFVTRQCVTPYNNNNILERIIYYHLGLLVFHEISIILV